MFQLVGFLLIALCAAAQARPEANVGVQDIIPGIGEYYFNGIAANWSTAYRQCQSSGGNLAVINSVAELEALQELLTNHGASIALVGFHDQFLEGVYTHITGLDVPAPGTEESMWASGYPLGGEANNCGYLNSKGLLDGSCTDLRQSICELSEDQGGEEVDDGFALLDGFGHYKYHETLLSWANAWQTCRSEKSDLMVLDSQEEIDALYVAYEAFTGFIWQGVHRIWGPNDGFVSVRNTPFAELGYKSWFSGAEPTGSYTSHPFLGVYDVRGLSSAGQTNIATFFCKRPL